jgi:hypothetical protein
MAPRKTRPQKSGPTAGVCGALLRLLSSRPPSIDEAVIRRIVGDRSVRTIADVGREFGLAANTIKQSWRPQGMPGGHGKYHLATILAWRLKYLAAQEGKPSHQELTDRQIERQQKEESLRQIKIKNDRLEREESAAVGNLIDRQHVATSVKTAAAVLAERMMKVPSQIEPALPVDIAPTIVADIQRLIRRELVAFSESMARDVLKQGAAQGDL